MRRLLVVAVAGFLASCAGSPNKLEVKQFTLRDAKANVTDDPVARTERNRLLYGAIGANEQAQRLGQYYTVLWRESQAGEPVKVVFDYQQGATGSRVKRQSRDFAASATEGKAEFRIIGDDYVKGGRVLAWRIALIRGGKEISHRQSYLWQ
ncbi:MAG TPA: hypothetical protein VIM57_08320 [Luteolibacter sp.]